MVNPNHMATGRSKTIMVLLLMMSALGNAPVSAADDQATSQPEASVYLPLATRMATALQKTYAADNEVFVLTQVVGSNVRYYPPNLDAAAEQRIAQETVAWVMASNYGDKAWLEAIQAWLVAEMDVSQQMVLSSGQDKAANARFEHRLVEGQGIAEILTRMQNRARSKRSIFDSMMASALAQSYAEADAKQYFGMLKISPCYRLWPVTVTVKSASAKTVLRATSCVKNTPTQLSADGLLLLDHDGTEKLAVQFEQPMQSNQIFQVVATVYQGSVTVGDQTELEPVLASNAPIERIQVAIGQPQAVARDNADAPLSVCADKVPAQVVLRRAAAALDEELVVTPTELAMHPVTFCRDGITLQELATAIAPEARLLKPDAFDWKYHLHAKTAQPRTQ